MPHLPTQPSRRTMLKVGANAAWAVPAIQIAAATPAFAASGDHATLALVGTFTRKGANGTANLTLQNSGNAAVLDPKVTISGAGVNFFKPITTASAGWKAASGASTVTFTHAGTLAAGGSLPIVIDFTTQDSSSGATNAVTVAAGGTKAAATDGAVVTSAKSATI